MIPSLAYSVGQNHLQTRRLNAMKFILHISTAHGLYTNILFQGQLRGRIRTSLLFTDCMNHVFSGQELSLLLVAHYYIININPNIIRWSKYHPTSYGYCDPGLSESEASKKQFHFLTEKFILFFSQSFGWDVSLREAYSLSHMLVRPQQLHCITILLSLRSDADMI